MCRNEDVVWLASPAVRQCIRMLPCQQNRCPRAIPPAAPKKHAVRTCVRLYAENLLRHLRQCTKHASHRSAPDFRVAIPQRGEDRGWAAAAWAFYHHLGWGSLTSVEAAEGLQARSDSLPRATNPTRKGRCFRRGFTSARFNCSFHLHRIFKLKTMRRHSLRPRTSKRDRLVGFLMEGVGRWKQSWVCETSRDSCGQACTDALEADSRLRQECEVASAFLRFVPSRLGARQSVPRLERLLLPAHTTGRDGPD